jgi:hypothetical protein
VSRSDRSEFLFLPREKAGGVGRVLGAIGNAREDGVGRERIEGLGRFRFVAQDCVDPETTGIGIFRSHTAGANSGLDEGLGALAGLGRERTKTGRKTRRENGKTGKFRMVNRVRGEACQEAEWR